MNALGFKIARCVSGNPDDALHRVIRSTYSRYHRISRLEERKENGSKRMSA